MKIYHEFLISRHFLQFVCDGKTDDKTIRYYLGKIENFYSELDYMHLTEFLSSQSVYMDSDFADEHDLDFMYHNSLISSSFEKSSLFKKFKFQKHKEFNDRIKHKKLNDSNLFFIYNDCDYEKEIES